MTSASATEPGQDVLRALHDHATRLAGELPGRLDRLRVRCGNVAIEIEWSATAEAAVPAQTTPADGPPAAGTGGGMGGGVGGDLGLVSVTSPIVGTFYHAPEPGARPFVEVGDVVEAGQTIGIVEAMKLLNPVAAEHGGTVARICAGNGEPVEFGQVLLEFAPADAPLPVGD
jgi:acetyl-CoA carboxylase biotin carboxyl carrier protein